MQGITIGLQFFRIWNVFQATLSSLDILLMKSHFPFSMTARELKHYGLHWMKVKVRQLQLTTSSLPMLHNIPSGGDRIPVELFQTLKDDAVKVLHSICQQIWKTQQWPQDWKRSVFIPIPKKGSAKECSNYHTIALISHASKVMHKILQTRLQQYVNRELPEVQVGFR